MFTEKNARKLFATKLKFRESSGGSHHVYKLCVTGQQLSLPTFPVVPRHSGDLSRTVQKGLASALGLNISRLLTASRCGISASCIYLCLAAKVLGTAMNLYRQDPPTYVHVPKAASATALCLLGLAKGSLPASWNTDETSALESADETYLEGLADCLEFSAALGEWKSLVNN